MVIPTIRNNIKTVSAKFGTIIETCGCTSEYQDVHYGIKKRVHNLCKLGVNKRCTVCGKVK